MTYEKADVDDLCLHGGCFDVYGSCIWDARYRICQCSQQDRGFQGVDCLFWTIWKHEFQQICGCYDICKYRFPLAVEMGEFGNREYYGDVARKDRPTKKSRGKLAFVNGDITYCFENDTMAIFYNQSDNPNLMMRVNCIGRVISDLSVFQELGDSVEVTFDFKNK